MVRFSVNRGAWIANVEFDMSDHIVQWRAKPLDINGPQVVDWTGEMSLQLFDEAAVENALRALIGELLGVMPQ
jgi:hypothetical protein